MDKVNQVRDQIDWSIVISTIVAAIILGLMVYGMKKAGLSSAANIVKAGA